MLGRSKQRLKKDVAGASALAWALAQDQKFRERLLSALEHGAEARRRARRDRGASGALARLATDQRLLKELRNARGDLQEAFGRIEKKRRTHKLRNAVVLGLLAALGIPRLRRYVLAMIGRTTPGDTGPRPAPAGDRSPGSPRLEEMTKDELYERAQAAGVPGRSEMTKEQLVEALRAQD